MTLVELLVVISIVSVLLALVAIYVVPAFSDNKNVIRGVDRVTTALLIAKQRALRDQAPRGVRFIVDPSGFCRQLQYIEQPDHFRVGTISTTIPNSPTVRFNSDIIGAAVAGDVGNYLVQPGDWLVIYGDATQANNGTYEIGAIPNPPSPPDVQLQQPPTGLPARVIPLPLNTDLFKVIRQPRAIAGEQPVDLPYNVVVDVAAMNSIGPANQLPSRGAVYEVLFDVSGSVLNTRSSRPLVMVIRDETQSGALEANTTRLLTVNPRTGSVAAHPVGPGGTPLQYATDGRSSGL
jgi:type II secretory pathway pseudopilin PulG